MQENESSIHRLNGQMVAAFLGAAVFLQMLIMASDVQYVTNLAKPKLGSYTIGLWHSSLGYPLYTAFAWIIVFASFGAILNATAGRRRKTLLGIAVGWFMFGMLFGHILPYIEQDTWAWIGFAAIVGFALNIMFEHFGTFVRRSAPDDASALTPSVMTTTRDPLE